MPFTYPPPAASPRPLNPSHLAPPVSPSSASPTPCNLLRLSAPSSPPTHYLHSPPIPTPHFQANPTPSSAASLLLGVEQLLSYAGQLQPSWRAIQPTWMTQVAVPSRTMGEVALLLAVLQQFVTPAARSLTRHVSYGLRRGNTRCNHYALLHVSLCLTTVRYEVHHVLTTTQA